MAGLPVFRGPAVQVIEGPAATGTVGLVLVLRLASTAPVNIDMTYCLRTNSWLLTEPFLLARSGQFVSLDGQP